jgi:hypothetical protein
MYQAIIEGHHTMVIDTVFALFSGTASTFYHFCDEAEDRLPYCEVYECVHCGNGTKYTNDFPEIDYYPEINRCCATVGSAEAYEKLQHLDFGSAYFLVCMTILMVAKISPVAVKVVVYLAVFKVCWEAMTYENRFGKGAGMVFLVACTCSLLIFIRITFIIRKFKEKNPEGGTKGALKNLYKACPLRWLALSQLLAFCGVYARFGMEDENTGLRKDYAVPHAFWHIGVMSATVFLSKFAVDFNANCKTSWMGGQGDESRDGTQMVKVEVSWTREQSDELSVETLTRKFLVPSSIS